MGLSPQTVKSLVREIELKDLSTAAHTWRVVLYTWTLAEHFGLDQDRIRRARIGAALHDVGKLDIPDAILKKPDRLTPDEYQVIKTHTTLGHQRLVSMGEDDSLILELVRHHHERADGLGYPDGIGLSQTPAAARYFAVVDAFDAMTSVRPYRAEVGPDAADAAIRELREGIGTHYCAECVGAFADLYERGELSWILEHFNDRREVPGFEGNGHVVEARTRFRTN